MFYIDVYLYLIYTIKYTIANYGRPSRNAGPAATSRCDILPDLLVSHITSIMKIQKALLPFVRGARIHSNIPYQWSHRVSRDA